MRTAPMITKVVLAGETVSLGLWTGFVFASCVLRSIPRGRWNSRHSFGSFASAVVVKRVTNITMLAIIKACLGLRNVPIFGINRRRCVSDVTLAATDGDPLSCIHMSVESQSYSLSILLTFQIPHVGCEEFYPFQNWILLYQCVILHSKCTQKKTILMTNACIR